ncbi:glycogen/starch synthase [Thalassotalea sp. Y01]|uniref:glycogen synthase n=1 Tax=Thalassotalea sp. Y01 TaxID=2729613 RepID=UPI00145EDE88|nr:glycogen/starch synthase [Thalassotalea sp. Y01]NMP15075.1 glycogen synthase [Thalassotalea sp. Y01]
MKVLMVASENDALKNGKVGGIGDVIRDIPKFLSEQDVEVDVITPGYQYHAMANPSRLVTSIDVPFRNGFEKVELYYLEQQSSAKIGQYVLESKLFCQGSPGQIYVDDGADNPFYSDANKFALFCASVCELLIGEWKDRFQVLHLHDWHSAFIPILSRYAPRYQSIATIRSVYSIHNLGIQGIRPLTETESSLQAWFPTLQYDKSLLVDPRYDNCINPTRAAINLADMVHVVSPTYRLEVMKASAPEHGFIGGEGLEQDLQKADQQGRFIGILNGCDYSVESPVMLSNKELLALICRQIRGLHGSDNFIKASHFVAEQRCQSWAEQAFSGPMLISVGRLTEQKVRLIFETSERGYVLDDIMHQLAHYKGRMIILGSGDKSLERKITQIMQRHENLLFINGFCAGLAEQLYVNGDIFFMPSSFEPCGISQMLAMRAAMPVIAHQIGGLNDTISHMHTGFLFSGDSINAQVCDLMDKIELAVEMYQQDKAAFAKMCVNAKAERFLWQTCITAYIEQLYR